MYVWRRLDKRFLVLALRIGLASLLSGCATTSRFAQASQQLQLGVTTRDQVVQLLGSPDQVVTQFPEGTSEDFVYMETKRHTRKGAGIGAAILTALVFIPAIILAPLTFGASLLAIPAAAGVGGAVGAAGGSLAKTDWQKLVISFNPAGVVESYRLIPLSGDVRVVDREDQNNPQ